MSEAMRMTIRRLEQEKAELIKQLAAAQAILAIQQEYLEQGTLLSKSVVEFLSGKTNEVSL